MGIVTSMGKDLRERVVWAITALVVVSALSSHYVGLFLAGIFGMIAFLAILGGWRLIEAAADFLRSVKG